MDVKEIVQHYNQSGSIRSTASRFGLSFQACRRILISAGIDVPGKRQLVKILLAEGQSPAEIARLLKIKPKTVNCYKTYTKGSYIADTSGKDNKIKNIRLAKGLSQRQLAAQTGLSQYAISAWERGKAKPRAKNLKLIASALDCNVEDLM